MNEYALHWTVSDDGKKHVYGDEMQAYGQVVEIGDGVYHGVTGALVVRDGTLLISELIEPDAGLTPADYVESSVGLYDDALTARKMVEAHLANLILALPPDTIYGPLPDDAIDRHREGPESETRLFLELENHAWDDVVASTGAALDVMRSPSATYAARLESVRVVIAALDRHIVLQELCHRRLTQAAKTNAEETDNHTEVVKRGRGRPRKDTATTN